MKKLFVIIFLIFCGRSYGQVYVYQQGTIANMCMSPYYEGPYEALSDIVLVETNPGDILEGGNCISIHTQSLGGGIYYFKNGTGTVMVNAGGDISSVSLNPAAIGGGMVSFDFGVTSTSKIDTIRIKGLRIKSSENGNGSPGSIETSGCGTLSFAGPMAVLTSTPNPVPVISYVPDSYYCNDNNTNYALTGTPSHGSWSGQGVSGANFNPYGLIPATKIITYTVQNSISCSRSTTINLSVKPTPVASLLCSDTDHIICTGQSVTFTGNSTGVNQRFQFYKNNIPVTTLSATNTYSTSMLAEGDKIKVVTDNGNLSCADTSEVIAMTVGEYPMALFGWYNTCGTNSVQYADLSTVSQSGSAVVSWFWDMENNGSTDYTIQNPAHIFTNPNSYTTRLTVTTDKGCSSDTLIKVFTLAGIAITPQSPYSTTFETTNATWAFDGKNASWKWSTVTNDSINAQTRKVWSTSASSQSNYFSDEKSYLNSPCFDFTQLDKPMISLKIWMETNINAGAILQASEDGGITWKQVGKTGIGTNWYNGTGNSGVDDFPEAASVSDAWMGNYNGWKVAKIALNEYAGKAAVRFRIAFGSSVVPQITGGMALDSVWVGNRSKLTLLEHFSTLNSQCLTCGTADSKVIALAHKRKKDVIPLYFHVSLPYPDSYNSFSSADASSRFGKREASSSPFSIYERQDRKADYATTANRDIDTNDVDSRALETPLFKIDLTTNMNTEGEITVASRITYVGEGQYNGDVSLKVVIVEDTTDGNVNYNWTVRKMLPDASGRNIYRQLQTWNKGSFLEFTDTWTHTLTGTRKFVALVFLETEGNRPTILQVAYQRGTGTSGNLVVAGNENSIPMNDEWIQLFPNPVSQEFHVLIHDPTNTNYYWELISDIGVKIAQGRFEQDQTSVIKTQLFPNGVYLLKVLNSNNKISVKKIVVQH